MSNAFEYLINKYYTNSYSNILFLMVLSDVPLSKTKKIGCLIYLLMNFQYKQCVT